MINESILEKLSGLTEEETAILKGEKAIDRSLYMDGQTDVITGDKLLSPDKNITIRPHTRFIAFPEHTHDYVEMVYMCQGTTTHVVNGNQIILKEGELLMLGQHARQSIAPAGKEDIAVNFIIRPSFLQDTLLFLGNEPTPLRRFILNCLRGEQNLSYLYFKVSDILPIQNLIENLLYTLTTKTPNRRGIYQMTMGLLFTQLLNHTETITVATPEEKAVLSVLRYIEGHYAAGSLTEIAARLHYDLPTLSRLILDRTGQTYTALVQEKRFSQAAWLLSNTTKKVDDIARSVGYENISYFHRVFTARYGVSPKKYRDGQRDANKDTFL